MLANGREEIRARTAPRFLEPNLHARLLHRTVVGHVVTDHEMVTRDFPEGIGQIELICIYEVVQEKIQRAAFVFGAPVLL